MKRSMTEAFLFESLRTPRGRGDRTGALYEVKPIDLLAILLRTLRDRLDLPTAAVGDLLIGCVTPVDDQGANLAKAALLHSGWDARVSGLQLNRFCASGLEAVNLGAMKIRSGWEEMVVAGGVESMSRVPLGSDGGPMAYDPEVINGINYIPPGIAADLLASMEGFDREAIDHYALCSQQRAEAARKSGFFDRTLIPIHDFNGMPVLTADEHLRPGTTPEALAALPPAFAEAGSQGFDAMALHRYPLLERIRHVHTAGNSAGTADGASLILLGSRAKGEALGLTPRARIRAAAAVSVEPMLMLTGPVAAARQALRMAGLQPSDIDLWECNESFAAVVLKFQQELKIDEEHLNVNGGAIAFGHPPGATGAMLIGALMDELERRDLQTGLVAMSAGDGTGVATVIERI